MGRAMCWLLAGGRMAIRGLVLAGVLVVAGAMLPATRPEVPGRPGVSEPDLDRPVETVALLVPEGMPARSLRIIDGDGRELATLTHLFDGRMIVVMRGRGESQVSCAISSKDRVGVEMVGSSRRNSIEMDPDGTARVSNAPSLHRAHRATLADEPLDD